MLFSLQPGKWTHIFVDKIWQQTKLPCAFSFKRAKILLIVMLNVMQNLKELAMNVARNWGVYYIISPQKKSNVVFHCTFGGFSMEIIHK